MLTFSDILQRIKENNYLVTNLMAEGDVDEIQNMTDEEFERLGRDVAPQHSSARYDLILE